jgi:hypothetical protein
METRGLVVIAVPMMTLFLSACTVSPETVGSDEASAVEPYTSGDADPNVLAEEEAELLSTLINCRGMDYMTCMFKCAEAGVSCAARYPHPYKSDAGIGDLYACKTGTPTSVCSYYYTNGDECAIILPLRLPLCVYMGGRP